ncbi:UPF0462 protein C4orf33 homolog isoform X2 [Oratosquilla oratoria]|uniref:UPF0462 protein C4orf33 homolog isoform X2 n=1 Tax=Oratosquilla oratoria TaxID=337810 RepID=UPI003F75B8F8
MSSTPTAISYHVEKTWNGDPINHDPVKITLEGDGKENLLLHIEAPFFNDPPNPGGKPGEPFFELWNYEVVEAFFLNDDNQYLEVEVAPWGQHIVLIFKALKETIRHSLPLNVETTIQGDKWSGTAKIPFTYLPPKVTRFNAYAIHGSEPNRIYEALYAAPKTALAPNFHELQYFSSIDLSQHIPPGSNNEMSELWQNALHGFSHNPVTTIDHLLIMISLQEFQVVSCVLIVILVVWWKWQDKLPPLFRHRRVLFILFLICFLVVFMRHLMPTSSQTILREGGAQGLVD